ncbi:MAG: outer membrane lipoprotein-sorting protein [Pseudomonadota bacterium]
MTRFLSQALAGGLVAVLLAMPLTGTAQAEPLTSAQALAERLADRPASEGRVGHMHFRLTNARGRVRERTALLIHSEAEDAVRIAIQFEAPAAIRNTGFLSHDFEQASDRNWLYVPVTRRVRRIPTADRGDPFMGTDLSYGDVKGDFKFDLEDWRFEQPAAPLAADTDLLPLAGTAQSDAIAEELGYQRFEAAVDPKTLFPVKTIYYDRNDKPLKSLEIHEQALVGDVWTAMHFTVRNLQTGHETDVRLSDMRYVPSLDSFYLSEQSLEEGTAQLDDLVDGG